MTVTWRELTAAEKRIIERLVRHASRGNVAPAWDIETYRAAAIDDFGSLRLRPRDKADPGAGALARPIASAYFDDKDTPDPYGPLVDIILFEAAGLLCELQIYRSDGGTILRTIEADDIFLVTSYEQHS
ncbi:hypothetical protein ASC97_02835 [Rhizobium sp. Root1203]|uniref:DUF6984 family protein n=1 Tax=Rhizobium sp. Root1203 TaxID=1736427 RepID=UPI00070DDA74|nr:hypothetical protein [Rhizobium sp. Root1203]KQV32525.1 hypothetical protein ASC97_02835 [Rhizobium sp. Root1203]